MNFYRSALPSGGDAESFTGSYLENGTRKLLPTQGAYLYANSQFNDDAIVGGQIKNILRMFYNCTNLNANITFKESPYNMDRSMEYMFYNCTNLNANVILEDGYASRSGGSRVKYASMFENCHKFNQSVDLRNITINVGSTDYDTFNFMFRGCNALDKIIKIPYETPTIYQMFCECTNLSVAKIIANSLESGTQAFRNCTNLKDIYINTRFSGNMFNMVDNIQRPHALNLHFSNRLFDSLPAVIADLNTFFNYMTGISSQGWTIHNENHWSNAYSNIHLYFNETIEGY